VAAAVLDILHYDVVYKIKSTLNHIQ